MLLETIGHTYKYECEKVCRLFFPAERIVLPEEPQNENETKRVITEIRNEENEVYFYSSADIDGKTASHGFYMKKEDCEGDSLRERILAKAIVRVLEEITGIIPPWGILTGIRPAKLMRKYLDELGKEKACELFSDFFEVSDEKTRLALEIAETENTCIEMCSEKSFSLYVSIPFCPTRCSYCSFVSHSVKNAAKLIPDYVKKICEEIEITASSVKDIGLKLETVYIGGGTPTSFEAEDLDMIISALNKNFDMKNVREFTVEAGRPDTIDEKKLLTLKRAGVSRISINPQTFIDSVLEAIGRPHTGGDTEEKYLLARKLGFDNINMDLIAGLPTDTYEGFCKSLDKTIELSPENITVHTLSLKRSAEIVTENETDRICRETERMVEYAAKRLYESGYKPYYMYRQSKSVGNLENVGWCKDNFPCLYNIYMMEEIHSVLAVGAAAVTKLKHPYEEKLIRVYNYKYPYEYIDRFADMKERKKETEGFYAFLQRNKAEDCETAE